MGRPFGHAVTSILAALEGGVSYGLDLTEQTGLLPGTVYTTLRRLEKRKLIAGRWEDAELAEAERRPRRRYYALTAAGARALGEARARMGGPLPGVRSDGLRIVGDAES